jgi:hypothetical protein
VANAVQLPTNTVVRLLLRMLHPMMQDAGWDAC